MHVVVRFLRYRLVEVVRPIKGLRYATAVQGMKRFAAASVAPAATSGELIFHILTALAPFERRLIQEHTRFGLEAARARGRKEGRGLVAVDHEKPGRTLLLRLAASPTGPGEPQVTAPALTIVPAVAKCRSGADRSDPG